MSAWRLAVRQLYELGGSARAGRLSVDGRGLEQARALGLVIHDGCRGHPGKWALTPLGIDWCEGRLAQIEVRPGGRRFVSTWLASLPRGVRINT